MFEKKKSFIRSIYYQELSLDVLLYVNGLDLQPNVKLIWQVGLRPYLIHLWTYCTLT